MSGFTPSSGQISLSNLQSVFGGTNPINFSEYYLNASTGYTTGVSGISNIGTQIALSNFYGKTKITIWPTPQQTNHASFGNPTGTGNPYDMYVSGASGKNLTRTGGSTFSNFRASTRNYPSFINYQNLILQAKPGDQIEIKIERWTSAIYYTYTTLYLNIGSGWFIVLWWRGNSAGLGFTTFTYNYTIPTSLSPGTYGIAAVNSYISLTNVTKTSCRFYSLHVV